MEITQDGLVSSGACRTFPPAVFLVLLTIFVYCTESEDSIDFRIQRIYSKNSLCLDSSLRVFVFDVTTHCHQQCACAHLANSASPISFNRFSLQGHEPYTHACKARPLTVVGWTSLGVMVIVIHSSSLNVIFVLFLACCLFLQLVKWEIT